MRHGERDAQRAAGGRDAPGGHGRGGADAVAAAPAGGARAPRRASHAIPVSVGAALVALGVVYGDLGTSPVYMTKAVLSGQGGLANVDEAMVLGMCSLVIWTLTLITTVKYVLIAMRADNQGEGGLFALYGLVRRNARWLIVPGMVGGAAFLADSVLTPSVAISSAVEGLRAIPAVENTPLAQPGVLMWVSIAIILVLFAIQHAGTDRIGRAFGPVMALWFGFLAVAGVANFAGDWQILRAFDPAWGIRFLLSPDNRAGLAILGSVFLTITGAEALYSDIGHVGRGNIYVTWPLVKVSLILNYLGQGSWLLRHAGDAALMGVEDLNPFFQMLPFGVRPVAVLFAVVAGFIASQALVSGSFTMVSDAVKLHWLPRMRVFYPSASKGQIYVPVVNAILCLSCVGTLLLFRTSHNMEAAYGLALTVTMLSTTVLLASHIRHAWHSTVGSVAYLLFFGSIELAFFASSLTKFFLGGYVTVAFAAVILFVMFCWHRSSTIELSRKRHVPAEEFVPAFARLHDDESIDRDFDNVVYLTGDPDLTRLDRNVLYSVFHGRPKRARAWWFVTIVVCDEPYTCEYAVESYGTDFLFRVRLRLGFKVDQNVRLFLEQIARDLVAQGQLAARDDAYPDFSDHPSPGSFQYVVLTDTLTPESAIPAGIDRVAVSLKYALSRLSGTAQWFGLECTNPIEENVPFLVDPREPPEILRVRLRGQDLPPAVEAPMRASWRRAAERARAEGRAEVPVMPDCAGDLRRDWPDGMDPDLADAPGPKDGD